MKLKCKSAKRPIYVYKKYSQYFKNVKILAWLVIYFSLKLKLCQRQQEGYQNSKVNYRLPSYYATWRANILHNNKVFQNIFLCLTFRLD